MMRKQLLILATALCCIAGGAKAQGYTDRYTPVITGTNGFRTVSEENALMEQLLQERRKHEKEESSTSAEVQRAKAKEAEEQAEKRRAAQLKMAGINKKSPTSTR